MERLRGGKKGGLFKVSTPHPGCGIDLPCVTSQSLPHFAEIAIQNWIPMVCSIFMPWHFNERLHFLFLFCLFVFHKSKFPQQNMRGCIIKYNETWIWFGHQFCTAKWCMAHDSCFYPDIKARILESELNLVHPYSWSKSDEEDCLFFILNFNSWKIGK